jgi:hypothetical protein
VPSSSPGLPGGTGQLRQNLPDWIRRAFGLDPAVTPRDLATTFAADGRQAATIQLGMDVLQGGLGVGNGEITSQVFLLTNGAVEAELFQLVQDQAAIITNMSLLVRQAPAADYDFTITYASAGVQLPATPAGYGGLTPLYFSFAPLRYTIPSTIAGASVLGWSDLAGAPGATLYVPPGMKVMAYIPLSAPEQYVLYLQYKKIPAGVAPF